MDLSPLLDLFGGLALMGLLAVLLRWTWGTGRHLHVPDPNDPTGDGLLTEVTRVATEAVAQRLRARLHAGGIRATIGRDGAGYRLLVFPDDLVDAKVVLAGGE